MKHAPTIPWRPVRLLAEALIDALFDGMIVPSAP
jgi:hypothetical protein